MSRRKNQLASEYDRYNHDSSRKGAGLRVPVASSRRALETISAIQMIVAPIAPYPSAKAPWLAVDLVFRPPTTADFATGIEESEDHPAEAPP